MRRGLSVWVVMLLAGLLAACDGSSGDGPKERDDLGGGGSGPVGNFDVCHGVYSHADLEAIVGAELTEADGSIPTTCSWDEASEDAFNLSVQVYAMDVSTYERTKAQFEDWDRIKALNGLGDRAMFAYRDMFGTVQQGTVIATWKGVGVMVLLTGTLTEAESEQALRVIAEGYLSKF